MNVTIQIKNIRKSKGISQGQMAEQIGVSRPQYSRLESGKADLSLSLLEKIAEVLKVQVSDFFTNNNNQDVDTFNSPLSEKLQLIDQLDEVTQKSIFKFIDLAVSNQRLKQSLRDSLDLAS